MENLFGKSAALISILSLSLVSQKILSKKVFKSCRSEDWLYATITNCRDGDTCYIKVGQSTFILRIRNIDAPELSQSPSLAKKSQEILNNLYRGSKSFIEINGHDRYGRYLGDIVTIPYLPASQLLLNSGLVFAYRSYRPDICEKEAISLEKNARRNNKGLWSFDQRPLYPSIYRKRSKTIR